MAVDKEITVRLSGSADCVVDVFDNWEGMGLISLHFGCYDNDAPGGVTWSGEPIAIDNDMAASLSEVLTKLASRE